MQLYGDTPAGMAESAMEFLRICEKEDFHQVVVSMKASNTRIMVYATRLLVHKMMAEDMNYPVHLGVTEAGEGEDGRIKSAVGMASLLSEGIGDTIRVSLTEDPVAEIPVAKKIIRYSPAGPVFPSNLIPGVDPFGFGRRKSKKILHIGSPEPHVIIHSCVDPCTQKTTGHRLTLPDMWYTPDPASFAHNNSRIPFIYPAGENEGQTPFKGKPVNIIRKINGKR
jgi:4-hydroxy-3-methylbut-2-en-1-yl diphosphate synthase IspG/GcpE